MDDADWGWCDDAGDWDMMARECDRWKAGIGLVVRATPKPAPAPSKPKPIAGRRVFTEDAA